MGELGMAAARSTSSEESSVTFVFVLFGWGLGVLVILGVQLAYHWWWCRRWDRKHARR
jgi:hypothetical protein